MKRKALVSLVLISSLTAWGLSFASPASASDSSGTPLTPPSACASPPSSTDATPENRDRFVQLWTPRVEDKSWFSHFVGLTSVPDDIKAEGFNDMDSATQGWLVACLVDKLVSDSSTSSSQTDIANYQLALDSVIFGKSALDELKHKLNEVPPTPPGSPGPDLTKAALNGLVSRLSSQPGVTSASLPHTDTTLAGPTLSSTPAPNPAGTQAGGRIGAVPTLAHANGPQPLALANSLQSIINAPLIQLVLTALADLEQLIANIQAKLFTLPVLNLLSTLFYKVCAESATQPLACSVSLPVGIPVPVDVNGDHFPDVLADLAPTVPTGLDFGVQFNVKPPT